MESFPPFLFSFRRNEFDPFSSLPRGEGVKKIKWREAKASLVVRGRAKFTPLKPGGRRMTVKHFPDFRRATPATCKYFYKYQKIFSSASMG